ncbi:MAG: peptidase M48 [Candidatus Marinimicrobia bacterium]|nr:peptidase M48 [Candidatus Neomarinimicrobiota bacterium]
MNIYFFIIPFILFFEYLLSTVVRLLNLRALDPNLPDEFKDTFDSDKYIKSQEYARTNSKFSYITSTFSLLITLIFIYGGIYNIIDQWLLGFLENKIIIGLLFFGLLTLITDIISLPFSIYRTFVIEEKFGFNKTTYSTFLLDKIKGYFLMIFIGAPVLSVILYFFETFPKEYSWIYAWVLITIFGLVMQPIFNILIAPMFNKFKPMPEGPLLDKIKNYLDKVNFPVKKLEIMDGSKRSTHSNAYFSGLGKNKRIALFDTLVEQMDDNEIIAVIAHEVGHYKLKHIHSGIILSAIQSGIMFYILSLFLLDEMLFAAFYMENISVYASLLFFSTLYTPISMLVGFLFSYISRKNEFAADAFSAETSKLPDSLITGLKKMSKENLSNLTPHWLNVMLNYTHPPVIDRIIALRKFK